MLYEVITERVRSPKSIRPSGSPWASHTTLSRITSYNVCYTKLLRYPNGRVYTCMMNYTGDACVFYCELYADKDDKVPVATGYAEEIKTDRGVNATSFVENCETSAIGRAIANCPLQAPASGPRPSRNEMQKVSYNFV